MELEELSRLLRVNAPSILDRRIEALDGTEYDMVKDALAGMRTIRLGDRDINLPGLTRNTELICQVLAEFKGKKKRNVQPLQFAKSDDIVIEPLRPEQFTGPTSGITLDNWRQAGLAVGAVSILPNAAQVAGGDTTIDVNDNEVFIITDWIEHQPAPVISAIQAVIDGYTYQPLEMRLALFQSNLQMFELDYPWICDVSIDINGKCEFAGTSELTPYGVHICLGSRIAAIT